MGHSTGMDSNIRSIVDIRVDTRVDIVDMIAHNYKEDQTRYNRNRRINFRRNNHLDDGDDVPFI